MTQEQLDDKIETIIMQKKHLDNKSIHIVDVVNICEELAAYVREETLREAKEKVDEIYYEYNDNDIVIERIRELLCESY